METLRKCPICGSKGVIFHIPKNTKKEMAEHPNWTWNYPGKWAVGCEGGWRCQNDINAMTMIFATKDEAIGMWNRIADAVKHNKRRTYE